MVPAVNDESGRARHVHSLIQHGLAGEPPHRQQQIGSEDEQRAHPAGYFDEEELEAQAARFLST